MTDTNQIHIFGIDTMEDLQEASKIFHSEIAKFGTVVASTEIQKIPDEIWENLLINRHFLGDWGDLSPEDKEVNANDPAVPPDPIVVCPPNTGKAAIPLEGVTVEGVASPIITDSVLENAEPALVTEVSVCIIAGTPAVNEPTFIPPIFPDVVLSPTVTDGVILFPLRLYVVPTLFVTT